MNKDDDMAEGQWRPLKDDEVGILERRANEDDPIFHIFASWTQALSFICDGEYDVTQCRRLLQSGETFVDYCDTHWTKDDGLPFTIDHTTSEKKED